MSNRPASNSVADVTRLIIFPWLISSLVFFVSLGLTISPAGNWLMALVVVLFSAAPIFAICYIGAVLLNYFNKKPLTVAAGAFLGLAFGYAGYLLANLIAYFQGTVVSFLITGITAGIFVSIKITANKALQTDRQTATRFVDR